MKKISIALATALLVPGVAQAKEESKEQPFELSGMATYVHTADNRWDSDNGAGIRGGIIYHLAPHWGIELAGHGNAIFRDSSGSHWQYGVGPELMYFVTKTGWRPYATLGVGLGYIDTKLNSDELGAYWTAGLGVISEPLIGDIKLRADVRYQPEFADDGNGREPYEDIRVNIGFSLPFGPKTNQEPKTKVITKVKEVVVEREKEVTKPTKSPIVLKGVNFETNSSKLTANARNVLMDVVASLEEHPDTRIEIAGHTDNTGSVDINRKLSQDRADSVRDHLVSKGIARHRIDTVGYGSDKPVASNITADGREQNRRIEMRRVDN